MSHKILLYPNKLYYIFLILLFYSIHLNSQNLNNSDKTKWIEKIESEVVAFCWKKEYSKARELLNKNFTESINDSIKVANIHRLNSYVYLKEFKKDKFLEEANHTINYLKSIKKESFDKTETFYNTYINYINYYFSTNEYNKANEYIFLAKQHISKRNKEKSIGDQISLLNGQGFINSETGDTPEALNNFKEALRLADIINDKAIKANTHNAIGSAYVILKNQDEAIKHFKSAIKLEKDINSKYLLHIVYGNLGIAYYHKNEYLIAKDYLHKAINWYKTHGEFHGLSESQLYLSKVFFKSNETILAEKHIDKSIENAKKAKSNELQIKGLLLKSELFKKESKQKLLLSNLQLIEKKLTQLKNPRVKAQTINELKNLYHSIDNEKSSFYNGKHQYLIDSIATAQLDFKAKALKKELDYLKLDASLKEKEKNLLIAQEKEKKSRTNLFYSISLLCTIIIFLIVIYFRQKKFNLIQKEKLKIQTDFSALKEEKKQNEIDFKNQQITNFAIHISEKNELLDKIIQQLRTIKQDEKRTIKEQVTEIVLFIKDNISQNKEKTQLYSEVDQTAKSFYHKIASKYPDLNKTENKIAAFLRLGHSSKQIALQLNITQRSVNNYRSNLRKKMNIPKDIKLIDFINDL